MKKLMIALMVVGAFAAGCGSKEGSGSGSGAAAAGDKVGIQACDDYITKMEACMAKDATTKAAMEQSFKTTRDAWKQAAAQGGAAKDALKQGCDAALAAIPPTCK